MSESETSGFSLRWYESTNKSGDLTYKAFTDTGINFAVEPIPGDEWAAYVYDIDGRRVVYTGNSIERAQRACGLYGIFDPARRCAAVTWSDPD